MRNIISDSSPIISLFKIDKLSILKDVYGQIIIPKSVYDEVIVKSQSLKDYIDKSIWINVVSIPKNEWVDAPHRLHDGEIEAISIALHNSDVDLLILDDLDARNYAISMGLTVTGTIGVLKRAKDAGVINEIRPLLDGLKDVGMYLSPSLELSFLDSIGESNTDILVSIDANAHDADEGDTESHDINISNNDWDISL